MESGNLTWRKVASKRGIGAALYTASDIWGDWRLDVWKSRRLLAKQ